MAKIDPSNGLETALGRKPLSPTAQRALAEAEERRRLAKTSAPAKEIGGREGLDPARYGDWEVKGITSDF